MKQILCIFTWCVMFMVLLWTLGACAYIPKQNMGTYMYRAMEFDKQHEQVMNTPEYQRCYSGFVEYLYTECRPHAEKLDEDRFWDCAWDALDEMEECVDG